MYCIISVNLMISPAASRSTIVQGDLPEAIAAAVNTFVENNVHIPEFIDSSWVRSNMISRVNAIAIAMNEIDENSGRLDVDLRVVYNLALAYIQGKEPPSYHDHDLDQNDGLTVFLRLSL